MKRLGWLTVTAGLLLVFLPLSAWLVSFFGRDYLSLGRDILLLALIGFGVVNGIRRPDRLTWLVICFLGYGLLSYYWREESLSQWLRGVRYVLEPLVLFLGIYLARVLPDQRQLRRWFAISFILIVAIGLVEVFIPSIAHLTLSSGARGYLDSTHMAGPFRRLQSLLAGPNALGLYLMIGLLLCPWWRPSLPKWLGNATILGGVIVFILTFSRSSYLGLLTGLVTWFVMAKPWRERPYVGVLALAAVALVAVFGLRYQTVILRPTSDDVRTQQYQRVWHEAGQIGLLGRGIGSAGPVSQYRLDDGANNYTENTYLDTFEALGLIGFIIYLGIWIDLLRRLARQASQLSPIFMAGLAIFTAGIFINHYTGQTALWTFWLLAGLALNGSVGVEGSNG